MSSNRLSRIKALNTMTDFTTPDKIDDIIYLGKSNSAMNSTILHDIGITHILMVGTNLTAKFPTDFIYKHIDVDDSLTQVISKYFDECYEFIQRANDVGGKILVHCHAGVSRSASIVIYYIMVTYKLNYHDALKMCRRGRPVVSPNVNFQTQLMQLDCSKKS